MGWSQGERRNSRNSLPPTLKEHLSLETAHGNLCGLVVTRPTQGNTATTTITWVTLAHSRMASGLPADKAQRNADVAPDTGMGKWSACQQH